MNRLFLNGLRISPALVVPLCVYACSLGEVNFRNDGSGGSNGDGDSDSDSTTSEGGTNDSAGDGDGSGGNDNSDDSSCGTDASEECECTEDETERCELSDAQGSCGLGMRTCTDEGVFGPCTVEPDDNDDCTCSPSTTDDCGTIYGSKGVCATTSLTCRPDGEWPASSTCEEAVEEENCKTPVDENCDGTVNGPDACPCETAPCEHGGTCEVGNGSDYSCDCSGTGYEGVHCDVPIARVIPGPEEASACTVAGVSDAGSVVAVNCEIGETMPRGYFWTEASGWWQAKGPDAFPVATVIGLSSDGTKAGAGLRTGPGEDNAGMWSNLSPSSVATLMEESSWSSASELSANGDVMVGTDPGGNIWAWPGTGTRIPYTQGGSVAVSGDGKTVFINTFGGLALFTSPTSSTALSYDVYGMSASFDGTTFIGIQSGTSDIFRYRNGNISPLNSTSGCTPLGINTDGRRALGSCGAGLTVWFDATPSLVQDLLIASGSDVTLRTDVGGKLSYNGAYVALSHGLGDVVIVHID